MRRLIIAAALLTACASNASETRCRDNQNGDEVCTDQTDRVISRTHANLNGETVCQRNDDEDDDQ